MHNKKVTFFSLWDFMAWILRFHRNETWKQNILEFFKCVSQNKNVQEINTEVTEPGNNKKCLSHDIKGLKKNSTGCNFKNLSLMKMSTKICKLNIQLVRLSIIMKLYQSKVLPSSLLLKTLCHKECVWPTLFIRLCIFSLKHLSVLQVLSALALQTTTNHNCFIKTKHRSSR
jgi:hypothetical protein